MEKHKKNLCSKLLMLAMTSIFLLQGSTTHAGAMTERQADPGFLSAPDANMTQMKEVTGRGPWKAIYLLVKLNIRIYGNLGWEYGRWEAKRKYGVDIGKYPGAKNVTEAWFKKKFK